MERVPSGGPVVILKTQSMGQTGKPCRVIWQRVGLLIVRDLQVMFNRAQKDVTLHTHPVILCCQEFSGEQTIQSVKCVARSYLRMFRSMHQLQVLGHKFNISDRACAKLNFPPFTSGLAEVLFGTLFHAVQVGAYPFSIPAEQDRFCLAQEPFTHDRVSGHGAGLEQGLSLPLSGMLLQVADVRLARIHQCTTSPPGTQSHVHPVQEPLRRNAGQGIDQSLTEAQVAHGIVLGQEQQVDVGTVIEFSAAQFAHCQYDKAVRCGM